MNRVFLFLIATSLLFSCSDDSLDNEDALRPGDIEINIEIKGSDRNLVGDGSGVVYIWVRAENTDQFKAFYNGTEIIRGETKSYFRFIAKDPGTYKYEVEIQAINTTSKLSRSKLVSFTVNKYYPIPESLYKNLMTGDKKWRIDTSVDSPVSVRSVSGEYIEHNLEMGKYALMYDDRYVFGFESLKHETMGQIVGKEGPLTQDFGTVSDEANENGEYENYPMESYSTNWLFSEGWKLHLEGKAFIGSYVGGNHVYEIQWHSPTQFLVRTLGADNNYWYFLMTSE